MTGVNPALIGIVPFTESVPSELLIFVVIAILTIRPGELPALVSSKSGLTTGQLVVE